MAAAATGEPGVRNCAARSARAAARLRFSTRRHAFSATALLRPGLVDCNPNQIGRAQQHAEAPSDHSPKESSPVARGPCSITTAKPALRSHWRRGSYGAVTVRVGAGGRGAHRGGIRFQVMGAALRREPFSSARSGAERLSAARPYLVAAAGRCESAGCCFNAGGAENGLRLDRRQRLHNRRVAGRDRAVAAAVGEVEGTTSVEESRFQPKGGTTCTMLPHLGQARIWPITDSSLTLSRAWQVVH